MASRSNRVPQLRIAESIADALRVAGIVVAPTVNTDEPSGQ